MLNFGIETVITDSSISAVELARWAEDNGFESLFMGTHSHIPTSRRTPFLGGGELPEYYKHFADPFIELTAAAVVTQKLKVGTGVCLLTEHHPISLAKAVATLDRLSRGRFLFGIGAGWNVEEMANHGVDFKDRWKVTREPVQAGGPPILLGAGATKWMPKRVVEYCNGWMPIDGLDDVAAGVVALRAEAARAGRSMAEFDLSIVAAYGIYGAAGTEKRVRELSELGFKRIILVLDALTPSTQWPLLEQFATLAKKFR